MHDGHREARGVWPRMAVSGSWGRLCEGCFVAGLCLLQASDAQLSQGGGGGAQARAVRFSNRDPTYTAYTLTVSVHFSLFLLVQSAPNVRVRLLLSLIQLLTASTPTFLCGEESERSRYD